MGLLNADLNRTKTELQAADSDIQATLEDVNSTLKNRVCIRQLFISNRPHFLWVYRRDNPRGMLGEHGKACKSRAGSLYGSEAAHLPLP